MNAYQLAPNNRDQPDAVLLEDLRAAFDKLATQTLTRNAYSKVGRFSAATIAARFGGWGKALTIAGLIPARHFSVSQDDCIADLRRVAASLGIQTLTVSQYKLGGRYSDRPFRRHFGGWAKAFKAAGLQLSDQFHPRSCDEELFDNLETVWQRLGRQPTVNDMFAPVSRFSAHTYKRRFGGFQKALEAFVAAVQSPQNPDVTNERVEPESDAYVPQRHDRHRSGTRSIGWRLRYLILKRDRFCCQACGRSPATDIGTMLQVDHVVPWSQGGSTVESNLQTLCERCNGGKGAT